ncbi:MAG: GDYXXLXY domain-containing protein [Bacteroidota bacterium]
MNSKITAFVAFVLVVLVQLYVPAKMIWDREDILDTGTEFKFQTAPIDPSDPFRGKYITLDFDEPILTVESGQEWENGESIYVTLEADSNGFTRAKVPSKTPPTDNDPFLKVEVDYVWKDDSTKVSMRINYPFDRYYMEESKAYEAEVTYREARRDTSKVTYALVSVKDGEAVLKDVMINGTPIREVVKANRERGEE